MKEQELLDEVNSLLKDIGASEDEDMDSLEASRWDPARAFFEAREAVDGGGQWRGWREELEDDVGHSRLVPILVSLPL